MAMLGGAGFDNLTAAFENAHGASSVVLQRNLSAEICADSIFLKKQRSVHCSKGIYHVTKVSSSMGTSHWTEMERLLDKAVPLEGQMTSQTPSPLSVSRPGFMPQPLEAQRSLDSCEFQSGIEGTSGLVLPSRLFEGKYDNELEVAVRAVQLACILTQRTQERILRKEEKAGSKLDRSLITVAAVWMSDALGIVPNCQNSILEWFRAQNRMDSCKEDGSSSQDRQSIPIVHEVGEGSSQIEEVFHMQLVTDVTLFKQLMDNSKFMEFLQSPLLAQQVQEQCLGVIAIRRHYAAAFYMLQIWHSMRLSGSQAAEVAELPVFYNRELHRSTETCTEVAEGIGERPKGYSYPPRRSEIMDIVESRWTFMSRPIHGMAAVLHPLYKKPSLFMDTSLFTLQTNYINKVFSEEEQLAIDAEFVSYMNSLGPSFVRAVVTREEATKFPLTWWQIHGRIGLPKLCRLALRILSQVWPMGDEVVGT
ncbi:hypothetical protein L7F22_055138 [Adiantum nelumboides]|nr:hypothetical protein [Adiantum nelumboides]